MNEIDSSAGPSLSAEVEVSCAACRSAQHRIVASTAERETQTRYLRRFHARRMRPSRGRNDLAERAEFADARTKTWATWEERTLKALWRAAAAADTSSEPRGAAIAPWCDAYYRLRLVACSP